MGQGLGGEESSTGHQLLSDYIIPDIKTTHTARVPAGERERRAGAELGQPRPQANSYFSPGARRWPRKWTPVSAQPRGGTPHPCLASRGAQGSAPRRLRGGTAAEAAHAGALGRASPQHPAAPRIPGRLPVWRGARLRSTFTWSSLCPPPARPRRLRRLRGGARELVGLAKRRGGGAGVPGPAARSLPGWRGRWLCVRPGSPQSAPALGGLAALLAGGRAGGSRRPGARRPLLLSAEPPPRRLRS